MLAIIEGSDIAFKKLQLQCRRGMLELDIILNCFLKRQYLNLGTTLQRDFAELLQASDIDLYAWLVQRRSAPENLQEIIRVICKPK